MIRWRDLATLSACLPEAIRMRKTTGASSVSTSQEKKKKKIDDQEEAEAHQRDLEWQDKTFPADFVKHHRKFVMKE